MELLILKGEQIVARATVESADGVSSYWLAAFADLPEYPTEEAPIGKEYTLVFNDGALSWELTDRPLTPAEQVTVLEAELDTYRFPEWVQPTGAHDAYKLGDKVSHNGKHWESTADNNVWEPGGIGTEMLWSMV